MIDKTSPIPLYVQVSEYLEKMIKTEKYQVGTKLPSEGELAGLFQLNRNTIRQAISLLGNRNIVAYEDGEPVKKGTVVGKLFSELGPRYLDRPGGYTRIVRLSLRRLGDNGELVLLQLPL